MGQLRLTGGVHGQARRGSEHRPTWRPFGLPPRSAQRERRDRQQADDAIRPGWDEGYTNWTVVFTHDGDDLLMKVDPDSTENNQADFEIRLSPSP